MLLTTFPSMTIIVLAAVAVLVLSTSLIQAVHANTATEAGNGEVLLAWREDWAVAGGMGPLFVALGLVSTEDYESFHRDYRSDSTSRRLHDSDIDVDVNEHVSPAAEGRIILPFELVSGNFPRKYLQAIRIYKAAMDTQGSIFTAEHLQPVWQQVSPMLGFFSPQDLIREPAVFTDQRQHVPVKQCQGIVALSVEESALQFLGSSLRKFLEVPSLFNDAKDPALVTEYLEQLIDEIEVIARLLSNEFLVPQQVDVAATTDSQTAAARTLLHTEWRKYISMFVRNELSGTSSKMSDNLEVVWTDTIRRQSSSFVRQTLWLKYLLASPLYAQQKSQIKVSIKTGALEYLDELLWCSFNEALLRETESIVQVRLPLQKRGRTIEDYQSVIDQLVDGTVVRITEQASRVYNTSKMILADVNTTALDEHLVIIHKQIDRSSSIMDQTDQPQRGDIEKLIEAKRYVYT
jgi:hypothetical protein